MEELFEVAGLLSSCSVDQDSGAVLVVGLRVVNDSAKTVAVGGGVSPPAAIGLLREELRLMVGGVEDSTSGAELVRPGRT